MSPSGMLIHHKTEAIMESLLACFFLLTQVRLQEWVPTRLHAKVLLNVHFDISSPTYKFSGDEL